jgi:peptidoglycan/LPS O-acetylase OafA/YrhL
MPFRISGLKNLLTRSSHRSTAYRPDVDGLRALAVLAVVIFHAFPSALPGGFVGVDVFFVISGYLITGIIVADLNIQRFSIPGFYLRRIKRIFPSLITILIACLALGQELLWPEQFKQLGSNAVAGALFIANLKYWHEAGYFDLLGETKPLLHLWSLGVEEQFYIVWPFLLLGARRLGLNFLLVVVVIAVASFVFNVMELQKSSVADFYSPVSRFWELMLGAALTVGPKLSFAKQSKAANILSAAGLLVLLSAVTLINEGVPFPGWWALLPTIGTALLLASGSTAWVNKVILSRPSLVGIGLISYPLYLWHWPLLSFAYSLDAQVPPFFVRLGAVCLSFLLAFITFVFVEKPVRFATQNQERIAAVLVATLIVISLIGYGVRAGFPSSNLPTQLINAGEIRMENGNDVYYNFQLEHFYLCTPGYIQQHSLPLYWPARCLQSKISERKDIAIVGDSHAEDLFPGFAESMRDVNIVKYIQALPTRTTKAFDEVFDYIENDGNIRSVILTAFWNNDVPAGVDLERSLTSIVSELVQAGKKVYVIDDRPNFPFDPIGCKYERHVFSVRFPSQCAFPRSLFDAQRNKYYPALRSVIRQLKGRVFLVDTGSVFCDEQSCYMAGDHLLYFRDQNHLTIAGSRLLAKHIIEQLPAGDHL